MRQPNILLIMADQLAAQFLPTYGHPVVQAPNIERLSAQGAVFDSAYANSPLCAPSRFMMMSGRLGSSAQVYDNASEFPAHVPTIAHHLRSAGYRTALSGKMHFVGPDQHHGFEHRLTTDIYPADFGWTPEWDRSDERIDWWYHNLDSVKHAGTAATSNQLDFDDETGFRAVRQLADFAREESESPWFLTVSFTHPHDPYVARLEHWDRYDHADIDLPVVGPIPDAETDPHSRRLRHVSAMDDYDVSDEDIRSARHAYYASISYVDDWVGRLLDTLATFDMADNTMIVFTADHGDLLGERGLWYKMSFFEPSCRIPLIISTPGDIEQRRVAEPVSLVDLLPTLTGVTGDDLAGTTLRPLMEGARQPGRTVYGEYLGEGAIAPLLMVRRGRYKYVHCDADPPQLFDLEADPNELNNLADEPAMADVLEELRSAVDKRWNRTALHQQILANQKSRKAVDHALRVGRFRSWDHEPTDNAAERYMRNHLDLNEVERGRRYPKSTS